MVYKDDSKEIFSLKGFDKPQNANEELGLQLDKNILSNIKNKEELKNKVLQVLIRTRESFPEKQAPRVEKISANALKKITEHQNYFVDGVALDNMPAGFFIKEEVLYFDHEAADLANKNYQNGYNENPVLPKAIDDSKTILEADEKETLKKLLEAVKKSDLKIDESVFKHLDFNQENFKSLAMALEDKDAAPRICALTNTLNKLKKTDGELYASIKKCFLDNSRDFIDISNPETLDAINKISAFTPAQKIWWRNLTEQHTGSNGVGKSDLLYLYRTFTAFHSDLNEFWTKLYDNKPFELPLPYPLKPIGNMQVALNRMAYIVKHAAYPEEQLQYLYSLNLQKEQIYSADNKEPLQFHHRNIIKEENVSDLMSTFLKETYTGKSEDIPYFPKYQNVQVLAEPLIKVTTNFREYIAEKTGNSLLREYAESLSISALKLAAKLLKYSVPAKKTYECINATLTYIQENAATMDSTKTIKAYILLAFYPIFIDENKTAHLNLKHFAIALNNPKVNENFVANSQVVLEEKNFPLQDFSLAEDILTCLLSIMPEDFSNKEKNTDGLRKLSIGKTIDELRGLEKQSLTTLARILANTDFTYGEKSNVVQEKELLNIVCKIKELKPPTYKQVRDIVVGICPNVKFLPDMESITELAEKAPMDKRAIIKLFEPIFQKMDSSLKVDKENIQIIIMGLFESSKKDMTGLVKGLVDPQAKLLNSNTEDDRITGLLNVIQNARDMGGISGLIVSKKVKEELQTIKDGQKETITELLKQFSFSEIDIKTIMSPINDIDLTQGNLIAKSDDLLKVTSWVKEFALNYKILKEDGKWDSVSLISFLKLATKNFNNTKDNINALTKLYIINKTLDKHNFCSPEQILKEIGPDKLEQFHLEILNDLAKKQSSKERLTIESVNLITSTILKLPEKEARAIVELACSENKYGDFPINDFLTCVNSSLAENKINGKDLSEIIAEMQSFLDLTKDKKSLNIILKKLLKRSIEMKTSIKLTHKFFKEVFDDKLSTEDRTQILKIFEQLFKLEDDHNIDENLTKLTAYLKEWSASKEHQNVFKQICQLYDKKPYPNSSQLLSLLEAKNNCSTEIIKNLIDNIEIDPLGTRLGKNGLEIKKTLEEQFSTKKVNQTINELDKKNPNLPTDFTQELVDDFNYINAIGNTHNFPGTNKPAWKMLRNEIIEQLKKRQEIIGNPKKTEAEKYLATLQTLALTREVMYRTFKGRMPNSTQIISVLLATKLGGNVCMQINTGEGKSITNPLLGAMQHFSGYAVNLFTSNTDLMKRDKAEMEDFWNYLEIPTALVTSSTAGKEYLPNGINYTTAADFALFSQKTGLEVLQAKELSEKKEKLEKLPFVQMGNEKTIKIAGVYDESDLAFYETKTEFNLSDNIDSDESSDPYLNPHAWAYPLINKFVEENKEYLSLIDGLKQEDNEQNKQIISNKIVNLLRNHLTLNAENSTQRDTISKKKINDDRLLKLLAAAESIKELQKEKDYIIKEMTREEYGEIKKYRKIVILDGEGHEIEGAVLANGAHQLLSAKLQEKISGIKFVMDRESFCISSTNPHTELLRMDKIIGISGTIGHAELLSAFKKDHNTLGIIVPPHSENIRDDLPPEFAENPKQHTQKIYDELSKIKDDAQLVIGRDGEYCEKLYLALKTSAQKNKNVLILATASGFKKFDGAKNIETSIENIDEAAKQASAQKTITISTPIFGRGINIVGLKKVIKTTFDPNARIEGQIYGRTGRYGAKGTTIGIYNWLDIEKYYGVPSSSIKEYLPRVETLKNLRLQAETEEVNRLQLSAKAKETSVRYQEYFDSAINKSEKKPILLFAKYTFIEKLETLYIKIRNQDPGEAIKSFNDEVEKIWLELLKKEELSELGPGRIEADERNKKNQQLAKSKESFYGIKTLSSLDDKPDINALVTQYNERNQLIYSKYEPIFIDKEEADKTGKQFAIELDKIFKTSKEKKILNLNAENWKTLGSILNKSGIINWDIFSRPLDKTRDIDPIVKRYIQPYILFAEKWGEKNPNIKTDIYDKISQHLIKNTSFNNSDNFNHSYMYCICDELIDANKKLNIKKYPINKLSPNDISDISKSLGEYINNLPINSSTKQILGNIRDKKLTGDLYIDYNLLLLRRKPRSESYSIIKTGKYVGHLFSFGYFKQPRFSDTQEFLKIVEEAKEIMKKYTKIEKEEELEDDFVKIESTFKIENLKINYISDMDISKK